jgi:hypothetical protein
LDHGGLALIAPGREDFAVADDKRAEREMVIAAQAFDELVRHGGGSPILPLDPLFEGISKNPGAPGYWWIYALLVATMIPSLLSLMIGGASLISGMPGLPSLLLRFMPEGKAVPAFDRTWLAITLTLQIFSGAILGIAAEAFLAVGPAIYVIPVPVFTCWTRPAPSRLSTSRRG